MASYREYQHTPVCVYHCSRYECPVICRSMESAVLMINLSTEEEHCRAPVNSEHCLICECAAPDISATCGSRFWEETQWERLY